MEAHGSAGTGYAFGHSDNETQRLLRQGKLFNPTTRHFLAQAGIGPGMKVLGIGSGAGDVSLLLADLVGQQGTVIGVDMAPEVLRTAGERVRATGLANVTFIAGDINDIALENYFDAAVGRCVLVHNQDPAATLRAVAAHVRPGGIIAFQEPAHEACPPTAAPPSPLLEQAWAWLLAAQRQAGLSMGLRLFEVFLAAGLPVPEMSLHTAVGGGPDWAGYDYVASHLRIILPLILRYGVATAEEVGIDTFAERLRAEVTGQRGVMTTWGFVTAWTRSS